MRPSAVFKPVNIAHRIAATLWRRAPSSLRESHKRFIGSAHTRKLGRLDDEQTDVIEQMLASDILPKATQDGFADRAGRLPVAGPHRFGEPFDAKSDAGAIHGLGNAVGVSDHNVAGPQRNRCFTNEAGNVLLQPQVESQG